MTNPPQKPRLPTSAPILVTPGKPPTAPVRRSVAKKAIVQPVESITPPVSVPPSLPYEVWFPWLWRTAAALASLVVFIVGMEVGYRRASNRYQPVIDELTQAAKTQLAEAAPKSPAKVETPAAPKIKSPPVVAVAPPEKPQPAPKPVAPVDPPAEPPMPTPPEPEKVTVIPPKTDPPAEKLVRFDTHIQAIVQQKCLLCHGGKSTKAGFDVRTAASILKGGDGGPGIVPGKADDSILWEYVKDDRMPPSKMKLTAAEKRQIQTWITQGAK